MEKQRRYSNFSSSAHNSMTTFILTFGSDNFTALLKSHGYDGVIVNCGKHLMEEVAVFNPNQIKAVDNEGTFSAETNNIYKALRIR